MATLILHGDETLDNLKIFTDTIDGDVIKVSDINVIVHTAGHNTTIIKSPSISGD